MLIDDDKDELSFFLDALIQVPCEDGFKCTYAPNADQAVKMLKFLVPDFIFLDYRMPELNGLEFLSAVRNLVQLNKTKIYLYSAHTDEAIERRAKQLGVKGCIKKMGSIKDLVDELKTVVTSPTPSVFYYSTEE